MRAVLILAVALACPACGPGSPDDAAAFCAGLADANEGCWSDDLDDECLTLYAECGEDIIVAESCPVQLGC